MTTMRGASAFVGGYRFDAAYEKIWWNMIEASINHSKHQQLSASDFNNNKMWLIQEVFLSRCYIMSDLFENDLTLMGIDPELVQKCRVKIYCTWRGGKSSCLVCGRIEHGREHYHQGKYLCWEHWRIVQEFSKGRDPEYKFKDNDMTMTQLEFAKLESKKMRYPVYPPKFTGDKITPELAQQIKSEYKPKFNTQTMLAMKYGISQPDVHRIICA